uniref:Uncharacterized protein n=1 Tax=Rhizophora mucronata TaxID=61149 RepID=A0A2P2KFD8_RHIMU
MTITGIQYLNSKKQEEEFYHAYLVFSIFGSLWTTILATFPPSEPAQAEAHNIVKMKIKEGD